MKFDRPGQMQDEYQINNLKGWESTNRDLADHRTTAVIRLQHPRLSDRSIGMPHPSYLAHLVMGTGSYIRLTMAAVERRKLTVTLDFIVGLRYIPLQ